MLRDVFLTEFYTILLVICLLLVAITKLLFPKRFQEFTLILFNFRYLKVYAREQKLFDVFEGLLFLNLVIGLTIFSILIHNNGISGEANAEAHIYKLAFVIILLIISKTLLERLISGVLNITFIVNAYLFQKISYKNFLGLLLIPVNAIAIYSLIPHKKILLITTGLILITIHSLGLLFFIKNNLKLIKNNFFYFILYLCALEISPYVVLYKLITR